MYTSNKLFQQHYSRTVVGGNERFNNWSILFIHTIPSARYDLLNRYLNIKFTSISLNHKHTGRNYFVSNALMWMKFKWLQFEFHKVIVELRRLWCGYRKLYPCTCTTYITCTDDTKLGGEIVPKALLRVLFFIGVVKDVVTFLCVLSTTYHPMSVTTDFYLPPCFNK